MAALLQLPPLPTPVDVHDCLAQLLSEFQGRNYLSCEARPSLVLRLVNRLRELVQNYRALPELVQQIKEVVEPIAIHTDGIVHSIQHLQDDILRVSRRQHKFDRFQQKYKELAAADDSLQLLKDTLVDDAESLEVEIGELERLLARKKKQLQTARRGAAAVDVIWSAGHKAKEALCSRYEHHREPLAQELANLPLKEASICSLLNDFTNLSAQWEYALRLLLEFSAWLHVPSDVEVGQPISPPGSPEQSSYTVVPPPVDSSSTRFVYTMSEHLPQSLEEVFDAAADKTPADQEDVPAAGGDQTASASIPITTAIVFSSHPAAPGEPVIDAGLPLAVDASLAAPSPSATTALSTLVAAASVGEDDYFADEDVAVYEDLPDLRP